MNINIALKLPTLFILTENKSKKRYWSIELIKKNNKYFISRIYGIIGGTITKPELKEVKSLQKGMTEIKALWKKKKESGFEEEHIESKKKTNIIKPMGAHKLDNYSHKIIYPACVQTKLDGFRCISHISSKEKNNNPIMYSKGMKPFHHLKHIKDEILHINELLNNNIYLDGELYEKDIKLHEISSLVMKKHATQENEENMKKISYYIFDMFDINNLTMSFKERYANLVKIFNKYKFKYIKLVQCHMVSNLDEINSLNNQFLMNGFEGVIVRNMDGIYKFNSKSYDVLRTKEFKKKDFKIIGAKEGTGIQKGAIIWNLQCSINSKKTFWAIPIGTLHNKIKIYKDYNKNKDKYIGKYAKVKFLEMNKDGCISRNPIVEEIYL